MSNKTLTTELNHLLDQGEPLLTWFPREHPDEWWHTLPYNINISWEMREYINHVAWRAENRERHQEFYRHHPPLNLTATVKKCEKGLLGWRSVGLL